MGLIRSGRLCLNEIVDSLLCGMKWRAELQRTHGICLGKLKAILQRHFINGVPYSSFFRYPAMMIDSLTADSFSMYEHRILCRLPRHSATSIPSRTELSRGGKG